MIETTAWIKKIALGTVQFGLDYGISNKSGQVIPQIVSDILNFAHESGIEMLDTAASYGSGEEVLGDVLSTKDYRFEIVSKFPADTTDLTGVLCQSLKKLRVENLKAYLAHDFDSFKNPVFRRQLAEAKEKGQINQIGVSVYYPEQAEFFLDEKIDFDVIQFPFNVFDQRFKQLFARLKEKGIEIHARSAFLQGLFFLPYEDLPANFASIKGLLTELKELCRSQDIPPATMLLNYAVMQPEIDKVVIGVTSIDELKQDLAAQLHYDRCLAFASELNEFSISNEDIILPFNW